MHTYLQTIKILILAVVFSIGLSVASAWTEPWTPPPPDPDSENVSAPINISGNPQIKEAGLIVANNPAVTLGLLVRNGNVGIGTLTPVTKLDVAGGVRLGNEDTSCTSANEGTLRYKSPRLLVCFPEGWRTVTLKDSIETFNINANPSEIVFDGENAWTADWGGTISKITPSGVVTSYPGGRDLVGIAFDGIRSVVAVGNGDVTRVNTLTGERRVYDGPSNFSGIASDGKNMWITSGNHNIVEKLTPSGDFQSFGETGLDPRGIAFDGTNMWTSNVGDSSVTKITSSTGGRITMTTYTGTAKFPGRIAFDGTNMWTVNAGDGSATTRGVGSVTKITPSGVMTTYTGMPGRPQGITFDGTNMWTANGTDNSITKITPAGTMTTYKMPGAEPRSVVFGGDNTLWVANYTGKSVSKVKIDELK